jgi:hypothetical protein
MACTRCQSDNQEMFPAEINAHFPGFEGLSKPTVWIFPRLLVCLDCGLTEFTIPGTQLQQLSGTDCVPQSKRAAA